jgi:ABC-2 type transport system ATP-binding protein
MRTPGDAVIEARGLTFEYPGLRALEDVSFAVAAGSVTALVGPNGAGKTTLLRCLAALATPFSGTARICGIDTVERPRACHRRLGFLPDFFGLYDELTVRRCLEYAARSRGVPAAACAASVGRAAQRLGITGLLEARAGRISRGQRQALAVAQAIIHEPQVLLLDEPASGLDPEARRGLAGLLRALRDEGMTILVSSHILAELEEYATEMLVLRAGRIGEQRNLGERRQGAERTIRVELAEPSGELGAVLGACPGVGAVELSPRGARFAFTGDAGAQQRLLRALVEQGLPLVSFAADRESLQDAYFSGLERPRGGEGGARVAEP